MVTVSISVMLTIGEGIPALFTRNSRRPERFERSIGHRLDIGLVGHVRADEADADLFLERAALFLELPDDHDFLGELPRASPLRSPIPLVPPVTIAILPSSRPNTSSPIANIVVRRLTRPSSWR